MVTIKNSYIRFLNCVNALEVKAGEVKIDSMEEQLLNAVMMGYSNGQVILVGDLLVLGNIGSQATLHGRLKNLVSAGYVKLVVDSVDSRKKRVLPTKLAIRYYEKLSQLVTKAVLR